MATQTKDLTQYKHVTLSGVTIWYDDSTTPATLVAVRLLYKKWTFFPPEGSITINPDSIGSSEIIDGSVQKQDLDTSLQQAIDTVEQLDTVGTDSAQQIVQNAILQAEDSAEP